MRAGALRRLGEPRDIGGIAVVLPREDTFGIEGFPVPGVEAEDPVSLRNRIPPFNVCEFAAIGFAGADMALIEIVPKRFYLFC